MRKTARPLKLLGLLSTCLSALMGNPDDLVSLKNFAHTDALRPVAVPQGWAAGVVWDGTKGTITSGPLDSAPEDWGPLLLARGLDPERYQVVGNVRWCSWDGWQRSEPGEPAVSAMQYSFKAEIALKASAQPDLEALYKEIRKARKRKQQAPVGLDGAWVIAISDWQTGNGDAGGLEKQLQQIADLPAKLEARLKALRKAGVPIGHIVIAGLGDLVEGCHSFYSDQTYTVQADRREQMRIVRRGVLDIVRTLAPLAEKVTLTAVGGNHGQHRQNGKAITGTADNDDVACFEQVAEILAEAPDIYGNVEVRLPHDRLALNLEAGGQILAITHGHIARGKGDPASTLWSWWAGQSHGRYYPVGDANVLLTGHYHHLCVRVQESRALFIAPSLTKVGDYWGASTGYVTDAGTLTFVLSSSGWSNLEVLR